MNRLEAFADMVQDALRHPHRDPHKTLQRIPIIRDAAPRPLYRRCECGWDTDACERESAVDGSDEGHVIRMERLEETAIDVQATEVAACDHLYEVLAVKPRCLDGARRICALCGHEAEPYPS